MKVNHLHGDMESWFQGITKWDYAGVVEAYYKQYAENKHAQIWGDKTPGYLSHIPLLKRLYPQAKFIHIIRDVRDYCLSIHKAWNKNILRAAQRWSDDIMMVRDTVR